MNTSHKIRLFIACLILPADEKRLLTSPTSKTIRGLAQSHAEQKKEKYQWRNRALSAERVIHKELAEAIKQGCLRHDREHGTHLGWRF